MAGPIYPATGPVGPGMGGGIYGATYGARWWVPSTPRVAGALPAWVRPCHAMSCHPAAPSCSHASSLTHPFVACHACATCAAHGVHARRHRYCSWRKRSSPARHGRSLPILAVALGEVEEAARLLASLAQPGQQAWPRRTCSARTPWPPCVPAATCSGCRRAAPTGTRASFHEPRWALMCGPGPGCPCWRPWWHA